MSVSGSVVESRTRPGRRVRFISSFRDVPRSRWRVARTYICCARLSRACVRDRTAYRNEDMDCCRDYGYAKRVSWPECAGTDGAASAAVLRTCIRVSWTQGGTVKLLWWDGEGLCLFAKRLEGGHFIWPQAKDGTVSLTRAQLSMLLEGIDWRAPQRTWTPELVV